MTEASIRKQVRAILKAHVATHGGAWWDFLDPSKNGVGNAFNAVKHEIVDPDSELRGTIIPEVGNIAGKVAAAASVIPGVGEIVAPIAAAVKAVSTANDMAKSAGFGARKSRPPTAHNLAVKKLMKDNPGMKLPEASKYVKAHGLAQKAVPKKTPEPAVVPFIPVGGSWQSGFVQKLIASDKKHKTKTFKPEKVSHPSDDIKAMKPKRKIRK